MLAPPAISAYQKIKRKYVREAVVMGFNSNLVVSEEVRALTNHWSQIFRFTETSFIASLYFSSLFYHHTHHSCGFIALSSNMYRSFMNGFV